MENKKVRKNACAATLWLATTSLAVGIVFSSAAFARSDDTITIDFPEQSLAQSLADVALLSGRTVLADDSSVSGQRTAALRGTFTLREALARLLAGTGLLAVRAQDGFVVRRAGAPVATHGT
ncbi:STN domain-containing protein [Novosphingobium sp. 9]|uniref:STN domain-containing protein n=1 Tax=Novosphingobium sp. 9 TaxID=2025349 RepID=UPI0021B62934|nr:STN domain-containing protein [Novosphingobium sp. 9]